MRGLNAVIATLIVFSEGVALVVGTGAETTAATDNGKFLNLFIIIL